MQIRLLLAIILLTLFFSLTNLSAERTFFPFDNAFQKNTSVEEQVSLLKELGYNGICSRPGRATEELFSALEKYDLKMIASYVVLPANAEGPLPIWLTEHIERLRGSGTIIWLSLTGKNAPDKAAVEVIRKVYDLCETNGVELVLYGHIDFKTDTAATCARLRELAERPGIGLSFTLCHELRQNGQEGLEDTIRSIAPHMRLVQISGANATPTTTNNWQEYIKPLGQGSFDMSRVIETLDEVGYDGPVNLQCYDIAPPAAKHLSESMRAWKQLNQTPEKL
ncbi:sugar phosphate isomerase/epimerase family protein [Rubellicoccus peritrichatus]|uniref:TIM barrel protein n=1 Tax=Rubellicoccus peritrichatus TaxID=3080537 RepID=A0AAQ3LBH9_9BACT|nr:TIM barrel protein [Puniceicoccus sp. CR14]WOO42356.1 TIM barrel protein [Puniceicoccus sp. CR14]